MLMSLPECLSWIILDSWLPEDCIPRLDSALCQLSTRKLFLTLLTTHAFTHREIRCTQGLKWMIVRSVTTVSMEINNSAHYLDKRLLQKYCQTNAGVVRRIVVVVRDSESDVLNIIAHTCQNLKEYRCSNTNVYNLSLLLETNPKLEHLATVLTGGIADEFGDGSLPLLHSAVVVHRNSHVNYVDALIRMAPNLAKLTIMYMNSVISTTTVLSTPCPKLRSLWLPKVLHGDSIVAEATLMCPNLLHLDLQSCDSITDTGVLSVVNNSTALRSLNVKNCRKITDQSMHFIANYLSQTLEILFLCENALVTRAGLDSVRASCAHLHTLHYLCDVSSPFVFAAELARNRATAYFLNFPLTSSICNSHSDCASVLLLPGYFVSTTLTAEKLIALCAVWPKLHTVVAPKNVLQNCKGLMTSLPQLCFTSNFEICEYDLANMPV